MLFQNKKQLKLKNLTICLIFKNENGISMRTLIKNLIGKSGEYLFSIII